MDKLSIKLAAFIIDSGTHAEWVFDPTKENQVSLVENKFRDDEHRSVYSERRFLKVAADALVFSKGVKIPSADQDAADVAIELMVGISPSDHVFSFCNSSQYPDRLSLLSRVRSAGHHGLEHVTAPDANSYREFFRYAFGFDSAVIGSTLFKVNSWDRQLWQKPTDYVSPDKESRSLQRVLTGDHIDQLKIELHDLGFVFVAARVVGGETPGPVFWANGHYTTNASDADEAALQATLILAEQHVQTRYLNSLLGIARGFCPHLLV